MKAPLYTHDGKKHGEIELPAHLFAAEVKHHLVHLALLRQHANARLSTAHAKRRCEIQGSTRKLYKQKGTGNARSGPIRSPTRRGGGAAWGPRNDTNWEQTLPKKVRRAALASCLTTKANESKVAVLESFNAETPKTKEFLKLKSGLPESRTILVVHNRNEVLAKSSRNLADVKPLVVDVLNVHDLTKYDLILFVKDALDRAAEMFTIEPKKAKPTKTA